MERPPIDPHRERLRLRRAAASAPSLSDTTWRELLRSYLEDSPHATQVLADFCRDREIQIIRYSTLDQRLRYVLGLLPPEPAHRLACDFVEHVLPETASAVERAVITAKRQWLDEQIDDARLSEAKRALVSHHNKPRSGSLFGDNWSRDNMLFDALRGS